MKVPLIEDFDSYFDSPVWNQFAETVCRKHNLPFNAMRRPKGSEHVVFLIDDRTVVKIYKPLRNCFEREKTGLEFARGKTSLPIPEILFEGELENYKYLVLTQQPGVSLTRETWLAMENKQQIKILSQLAAGLRELHSHKAETIDFNWREFIRHQSASTFARQKSSGVNDRILDRLPEYLEENLKLLPTDNSKVFLHGDIHFGNLRFIEKNGEWRISGLLDFADSLAGFYEFDLLAIGVLMIQGQGELQREFFRAYGYADGDINETLRRRLMLLTILYECSDLRRYALRLRPEAVNYALDELESAIWNFV